MSFTDYLETQVMNHVFGPTAMTKPASLHVALLTTGASDAGGGTEVSSTGTGYQRRQVTFAISGTNPTRARNTALITFGAFTADLPPVVGWAVFDAASGGNMLMQGVFSAPRSYFAGDRAEIDTNEMDLRLD